VSTSIYDLEEALDDLEREYFYGNISREDFADRRDAHVAWFAERGVNEIPADTDD